MGDEDTKEKLKDLFGDSDEPSEEELNFYRNQFDPEIRLKQLKHELRCEVWNGETYEAMKGVEPLLNEKGISFIMAKARSIINADSVLGNITEDEFNELMLEFNIDINDVITSRRADFGIRKGMVFSILNIIDHKARTFLSGSINGRRAELLSNIVAKQPLLSRNNNTQKSNPYSWLIK